MRIVGGYLQAENFVANASKTHKPKMTDIHGRTWDIVARLSDGETKVYADTTWGFYGYFEQSGQWYKFRMIGSRL